MIPIPIDASPSGVAPALPTAEPCRASLCVQATLRPTAAHPRAAAAAATRTRRTATRSGRRSRRGRRPGRWCGRRQRYAKNNACLLELAGLKRECQAVKRGWQVSHASSPRPPPPPLQQQQAAAQPGKQQQQAAVQRGAKVGAKDGRPLEDAGDDAGDEVDKVDLVLLCCWRCCPAAALLLARVLSCFHRAQLHCCLPSLPP